MQPSSRLLLAVVCLAVALVGVGPFASSGCHALHIADPTTGQVRDATPEEIAALAGQAQAVAATALVAAGQPQYLPIADIAIRLVALFLAWKVQPAKIEPQS